MEFNFGLLFLLLALNTQGCTLKAPLTEASQRFFSSSNSTGVLIAGNTDQYAKTLLEKWGSAGLSVAAIRKDDTALNSKLFLAMSVGLLISNKTLAEERGKELKWSTKIHDLVPKWCLMDEEMNRGVSLQDMLSHRTGIPRHDFSDIHRKGGVSEMVSQLLF